MEQIELIEVNMKYADDIWKFRQEILECDAESEDQFAGCMSLDTSESADEWIKVCELRKSDETEMKQLAKLFDIAASCVELYVAGKRDEAVRTCNAKHDLGV